MNNLSKALEETWACKEAVYQDVKHLDALEALKYLLLKADQCLEKNGYRLELLENGCTNLRRT